MKRKKLTTTRRRFLQATAIIGAGSFFSPAVLAEKSPNSKLNIAVIGVGGRGGQNIVEMVNETKNSEKLLAFCDVNSNTLTKQSDTYKVEHRYKDYRVLFDEKGKELDAVLIATLDHTHGIIACNAMNLGLHCYCEKPLANSIWETRQMADFAQQKKLCTQTGTQVRSWNGAHYYRAIELIRAGAIGDMTDISDVHIWCRGTYTPKQDPVGSSPIPDGFDYDLWLGGSPFRPFHNMWLSFSKYGFWHSGNGWITGMGAHTIDLAWTALNLTPPSTIEVDSPEPHPLYNRDQLHVVWTHQYPNGKTLKLHWYDGNRQPEGIAEDLIDLKPQAGVLFVGKNGSLQVHYGYHTLFPKQKFVDFQAPKPTYSPSVGHHRQWLEAIKSDKPEQCECRFEYAEHYSEAIIVAATMHRTGIKKVTWNAKKIETNSDKINAYIKPTFREGWNFPTTNIPKPVGR
ncbi:MAG: Gfo/Idh/MocA family oxidoreductase [Planctomycetaceae bacterium]|jgi:predicted dehydrogenase|nr:Gfo/Idh/MocA family oxidoreductase [Planctomycetaceae bacterium]